MNLIKLITFSPYKFIKFQQRYFVSVILFIPENELGLPKQYFWESIYDLIENLLINLDYSNEIRIYAGERH